MKKFIYKFFVFIILFGSAIFLSLFILNKTVSKKALFKTDPVTESVILGHSHSECAFNDSLIKKFVNYSQSGESYFYTFFKAKKLIEQNKTIKSVFIEFSNNQIEKAMDDWIWGDVCLSHRFSKYSPFMEFEDHKLIIENNLTGYINVSSTSLKTNFANVFQKDFDYTKKIGGYLFLNKNKTDSLLTNQKNVKNNNELSENNLVYLEKIINICKENNVIIYFIRSPLHNKYAGYKNEKQFKQLLSSRFSKIQFLDFSKFPISNSEFADPEHLNYLGAKKFSGWFNDLINKGLLTKTNKQEMIDQALHI